MGKEYADLLGKRFGRLLVIKHLEVNERKDRWKTWVCKCDCGNIKEFATNALTSGEVISCGCYNKEKTSKMVKEIFTTHGCSRSRIYNIWCSMKARCFRKNAKNYALYGGRGITVCDEWKNSFQTFYDWAMANGYSDVLTLDRKDVNGNYEPNNCKWATYTEQANNRRNTKKIEINGVFMTVREISEEYGIKYNTVSTRYQKYRKGLCSVEDIIKPIEKR